MFNGNPRHNSRNNLAYLFAQENKLKMLSGSDFHQIEELACGGIVIQEKIHTSNELVRIIKENKILELIMT